MRLGSQVILRSWPFWQAWLHYMVAILQDAVELCVVSAIEQLGYRWCFWLQYLSLRHRRKNSSSLARSAAEVKPAHAGAQDISLANTVALKTSLIDAAGMP